MLRFLRRGRRKRRYSRHCGTASPVPSPQYGLSGQQLLPWCHIAVHFVQVATAQTTCPFMPRELDLGASLTRQAACLVKLASTAGIRRCEHRGLLLAHRNKNLQARFMWKLFCLATGGDSGHCACTEDQGCWRMASAVDSACIASSTVGRHDDVNSLWIGQLCRLRQSFARVK